MTIKNHLYNKEQWNKDLALMIEHAHIKNRIQFTAHFRESLQLPDRRLTPAEVYSIFKNGSAKIIQGHAPNTYSLTGGNLNQDEVRVVKGVTGNGDTIHVVVAITKNRFKFVTVYLPSRIFFEKDLETLRKKWWNKQAKPEHQESVAT